MKKSGEITLVGILSALAIILGYLERLTPPIVPALPGIKIGISNIVIVTVFYLIKPSISFKINFIKITAVGILFGGLSGMIYAMFGGILSFIAMYILKKSNLFGIIGVSVAGGVFHNLGQLIAAALVMNTTTLFFYAPVVVFAGIFAGIFVGTISFFCLKKIII